MGKVIATFNDAETAEKAAHSLKQAGFDDKAVSLVAKDVRGKQAGADGAHHRDGVSDGTAWGAGIGAGAGILAGAGLLTIPGIGPLLAIGPLAAGLTGMTAGGLTGAFIDWGIPSAEGKHLQKEVEEGRAVVLVDAPKSDKAEQILREQHAEEVKALQ